MSHIEKIKFGITFRLTDYAFSEVSNFIECADGIEPIELKDRYVKFLDQLTSRKIKKSTIVDRDVLIEFQRDLDNRADIDYIAGHHDDDPKIMRGGETFYKYSNQLKAHLSTRIKLGS